MAPGLADVHETALIARQVEQREQVRGAIAPPLEEHLGIEVGLGIHPCRQRVDGAFDERQVARLSALAKQCRQGPAAARIGGPCLHASRQKAGRKLLLQALCIQLPRAGTEGQRLGIANGLIQPAREALVRRIGNGGHQA
jgi:hypothetical protein